MPLPRRRVLAMLPLLLLAAPVAVARVGSGQHYSSSPSPSHSAPSHSDSSSSHGGGGFSGGGSGGDFGLVWFLLSHPVCFLVLLGGGYLVWRFWLRRFGPTATTQRALERTSVEERLWVSGTDVQGWVNALHLRDPRFDLVALLDRVQSLFVQTQAAWLQGDLAAVRPYLSDATWQRLRVQLQLLATQRVRNVMSEVGVLDLQLIGIDQSEWFDTAQVRIKARSRDVTVDAAMSAADAELQARRAPLEEFIEVWSFVRRPGVKSRGAADLGKCPNCGAPFAGGASTNCSHCGVVVNSGNYDWVLAEITQGVEATRHAEAVDGLVEARRTDPALNLETLEDRASLLFWKWVEAQSLRQPDRAAKLCTPGLLAELKGDAEALRAGGRRRIFQDCAVGMVTTRAFDAPVEGLERAQLEIRWSARIGVGPETEKLPVLPVMPQRWMFTLARRAGATTSTANGMSTMRCPHCNAPLTETLSPNCDFCGAVLSSGDRDWVLAAAEPYDAWTGHAGTAASPGAARDGVLDRQERERLLYMMAAMAAADGTVEDRERKLLRLCAERWGVPFANVEMALQAGPAIFERMMPRPGREAESFLRSLVQMALVDGRIDRKERQMLEGAALRLGLRERLDALIAQR